MMLISNELLPRRVEYLELERAASRAYLDFVYDDPVQADLIRERLFEAGVAEFSAPYGQVLLAGGHVAGMICCLAGEEVTRRRMRSAMLLARSGMLDASPDVRQRLEHAARTLIKLTPSDYYLSRIAVRPGNSPRGAADELMRFCESEARRAGARRICLEVAEDNERATRFYQRWSFVETDRRSVTDEATSRSLRYVHMVKLLV